MQISKKTIVCMLLFILFAGNMVAQNLMTNVYGRDIRSLMVNGMPSLIYMTRGGE